MYIVYVPKNVVKALWFKVSLRPVAVASKQLARERDLGR
jgi:hypothetical protein